MGPKQPVGVTGPVETLTESYPSIHKLVSRLAVAFAAPSQVSKPQFTGIPRESTPFSKLGFVMMFTLEVVACAGRGPTGTMLVNVRRHRIRVILFDRILLSDVVERESRIGRTFPRAIVKRLWSLSFVYESQRLPTHRLRRLQQLWPARAEECR